MSTSINMLCYDILGILRSGSSAISDDDSVSLRQIAFWVKGTRASLIRQQMSKGQSLSDNIVQSIPCLSVSQIDASTCCDLSSDCYVVRSDSRIPRPIEGYQRDLIERVMPQMIGARPYPFIPYARANVWGNNRFSKGKPAAFLHDGYLYIMNSDFITQVTVDGVFEDPSELANFGTCTTAACYTDDDPYPISAHMIETMKKMIIDTNFRIIMQNLSDTHNDASGAVSQNLDNNGSQGKD